VESRTRFSLFTILTVLTAALGCLQPGIDPVFLTLLSTAHPVAPADHGWIVGATQTGMAVGSLIVWRLGALMSPAAFLLAALAAMTASLATAQLSATPALLAIRFCYGLAMGLIYIRAMSAAAVERPNGAYGAVFLVQLIISTLVALALPLAADAQSPRLALALLALVPLLAFALMLASGRMDGHRSPEPQASVLREERHPVAPAAWALALASLAFSSATMMIWSFTGALALAAGIDEQVIGQSVAIGSIVGAITALCVMREKPLVPLVLTGTLSGFALLSPVAATASGRDDLFMLSVILLNIGSTAIIIRCSGMAAARSRDSLFQRLVACTHSFGMILGPVAGSLLTASFGATGLLAGAIATLLIGCTALLASALWDRFAAAQACRTSAEEEIVAHAQ